MYVTFYIIMQPLQPLQSWCDHKCVWGVVVRGGWGPRGRGRGSPAGDLSLSSMVLHPPRLQATDDGNENTPAPNEFNNLLKNKPNEMCQPMSRHT